MHNYSNLSFSLHFHTVAAPNDYVAIDDNIVMFGPSDTLNSTDCVPLTIISDSVVELNENFSLLLTSEDPAVNVAPVQEATITILDDDGKLTFIIIDGNRIEREEGEREEGGRGKREGEGRGRERERRGERERRKEKRDEGEEEREDGMRGSREEGEKGGRGK